MIKKVLFALAIILTGMSASAATGTWKIHPIFGAAPTSAIDLGDKVFYLVSKNLYCYDKETTENSAYDKSNYLSDTQISKIFYNYDKKYLFVAYENSDIDIILDNGRVVNIPDITNALLTSAKTINDVTFAGDRIYVATAFGYVAINDQKYEIAESRIYNTNITSVAKVGKTILLGSANGLYYGDASKQHSTLATYTLDENYKSTTLYPLEGDAFLQMGSATATYKVTYDENNVATGISKLAALAGNPTTVQPQKSIGKVIALYAATPCYYTLANDGTTATKVALPAGVKNEIVTSQESDGSWWAVGASGIRKLTISGTTATTVLDYQKINASSVSKPMYLTYNKEQDYLFVSNSGKNHLYTTVTTLKTTINTLKGSNWTVLNPTITQHRKPTTKYLYNTAAPVVDPTDSRSFFMGSEYEGVFKFTDFEQVAHWDWTNSTMTNYKSYNCNASGLQFDKAGNMWVVQGEATPAFMVLPKDKINSETPSKEDWIIPDVTIGTNWRQVFCIAQKSNIKMYSSGAWGGRVVFIQDNGDPAGPITKKEYIYNKTLDQDQKNFVWYYVHCFTEDNNGKVWMGCDKGVVEWDPQAAVTKDNYTVRRLKIPRNDGTNNADYLLDGVQVNCIAVDGSNRKWIGTNSSGLLLVNEDGSEILQQFTTSNSILPTDKIVSVCCNPNNNIVYIGTESGLLEYESDSSAPAPTYDDVYVYPNPVRPDYTGLITIKGLMDNSLVKISDSAGNVVATVQSNGGMATWDGCNINGERVKSGVYFVLASENEDDTSNAVVAKFLVIR